MVVEVRIPPELPGMLSLVQATRAQKWPQCVDAQEWTKEWLKAVKERPEIAGDEGTMLAWFANAIMAGYDYALLTPR